MGKVGSEEEGREEERVDYIYGEEEQGRGCRRSARRGRGGSIVRKADHEEGVRRWRR